MQTANTISARFRATLTIGAIIACPATSATGQDIKAAPLPPDLGTEHVSSALVNLVTEIPAARRSNLTKPLRDGLRLRAEASRIKMRQDDKVLVKIVAPPRGDLEPDLDIRALETLGIEIGLTLPAGRPPSKESIAFPLTRTPQLAEAWLPLTAIGILDSMLPEGYRVLPITPLQGDQTPVTDEGPAQINSNSYRDGGADGTGMTIAVIDGGFSGLTAARNNGDAPPVARSTQINFAPGLFEEGDDTHGTGCVEAAFDHAPGATWRLYRIDSSADYPGVINDCISNGVDIISHSMSQYNEGWDDNSGITCGQALIAASRGILFFTSAGNRAESHYEGRFVDADGDGLHEFAPGDETINVTIHDGLTGTAHYLSWSNPQSDYDLILYNSSMTRILAASTNPVAGLFEELHYRHSLGTIAGALVVRHRSGPVDSTLEIFSHNSAVWDEHKVAESSTTSPSNTTHPNVIVVGAVHRSDYRWLTTAARIESYSSRGPSNGGMTLPDLCGPTNTVGFTYPGNGFNGTSCATPNAAGAACAFWSADRNLRADGIRWLLFTQAKLRRPYGPTGAMNNTWGVGGIHLVDFREGTRWLARDYPGTRDDGTVPFHSVAGAQAKVPNNGRLLILGADYGTFPEPVTLGNVGKNFIVEGVAFSSRAKLGE